jgi:hypothetical protein
MATDENLESHGLVFGAIIAALGYHHLDEGSACGRRAWW